MGRGSRLVRCPQSEIVEEVRMNPLGRERTKEGACRVAGAGCIQLLTPFLDFFLCKPEPTCFIMHVRRSDLPLPSEGSLPYSIGKVNGGFIKSTVSAINFLGKYSSK